MSTASPRTSRRHRRRHRGAGYLAEDIVTGIVRGIAQDVGWRGPADGQSRRAPVGVAYGATAGWRPASAESGHLLIGPCRPDRTRPGHRTTSAASYRAYRRPRTMVRPPAALLNCDSLPEVPLQGQLSAVEGGHVARHWSRSHGTTERLSIVTPGVSAIMTQVGLT